MNTLITITLQLIQIAILGRLLGPKAFGLMAMVMVVTGFAQVIAEMELSSAIIQRRDPTKEELSTLYWVNIFAGFIMYGILCMVTPLVAKGFGAREINLLLPVLALSFVISPFGAQFQTLLQKALLFNVITKINILSIFVSVSVAISFAFKGYGVWSLVWGSLSNCLVRTGLLMLCGRKMDILPMLHFKWSNTKGYLSFGLYRVGAMAANNFNSRVDQLIIGALMGPVALGYYHIAIRLVLEPVQRINPILTSVSFPIFSIIQDDIPRLKKGFIEMIRFLMSINAPLLLGLACVAPVAVPIVVGEQWAPSIPLVQVLALYALIRSLGDAGGSLILAKGKAKWTLYWNVALLFLISPVVYIAGLGGNTFHIAFALVGLQVVLSLCHYRLFIRNLIGRCFSEYIKSLIPPILLAIAMSAVVLGFPILVPGLPLTIKLLVQIGIGATGYIVLLWFFQKKLFIEIIEFIPARFGLGNLLKQFV